MKPQPGDISIVEKAGTFLLWYDNAALGVLDIFSSPPQNIANSAKTHIPLKS
jgi:hypothetical protein